MPKLKKTTITAAEVEVQDDGGGGPKSPTLDEVRWRDSSEDGPAALANVPSTPTTSSEWPKPEASSPDEPKLPPRTLLLAALLDAALAVLPEVLSVEEAALRRRTV